MKVSSCSNLSALMFVILMLSGQSSLASQGSVTDRILEANEPFDNSQIESAHSLPDQTVWAKETFQGRKFKVLARKNHLERYRCTTCHNKEKKVLVNDGALLTHGNITMNHGQGDNNS